MSKREEVQRLTARLARQKAKNTALEAKVATLNGHLTAIIPTVRSLLDDNKRLRIENHELAAHKRTLVEYIESASGGR